MDFWCFSCEHKQQADGNRDWKSILFVQISIDERWMAFFLFRLPLLLLSSSVFFFPFFCIDWSTMFNDFRLFIRLEIKFILMNIDIRHQSTAVHNLQPSSKSISLRSWEILNRNEWQQIIYKRITCLTLSTDWDE